MNKYLVATCTYCYGIRGSIGMRAPDWITYCSKEPCEDIATGPYNHFMNIYIYLYKYIYIQKCLSFIPRKIFWDFDIFNLSIRKQKPVIFECPPIKEIADHELLISSGVSEHFKLKERREKLRRKRESKRVASRPEDYLFKLKFR